MIVDLPTLRANDLGVLVFYLFQESLEGLSATILAKEVDLFVAHSLLQ
jgi:hypothetical protein